MGPLSKKSIAARVESLIHVVIPVVRDNSPVVHSRDQPLLFVVQRLMQQHFHIRLIGEAPFRG